MTRLCRIDIDDRNLAPPTPEIEQERRVAIYDLLEDNAFGLPPRDGREPFPGPFCLGLAIRDGRLVFDISTEDDQAVAAFHLSLGPFRQVAKDYFQICESYFNAVKRLPPSQIEAIDMARRGLYVNSIMTITNRHINSCSSGATYL